FLLHAASKPLADVWRHVGPDVIVAFRKLAPKDAEAIRGAGIALIDSIYPEERGPAAAHGLDQSAVGRMQLEHLTGRGHRVIGVATSGGAGEALLARARPQGVRDRCRELGLDDPVVTVMEYTRDSAAAALRGWREAGVTAVAAFNDLTALAVLA